MGERQILNQNWILKKNGTEYKTEIPCTIYGVLFQEKEIEDPYWRNNEEEYTKLSKEDYQFSTNFDVEDKLFKLPRIWLNMQGIDTLSTVYLNGCLLGETNNMHRVWEFDVKELLKPQGNELRVQLHSPISYIKDAYENNPCDGAPESMKGFPHLRKAHCMFGWDWGPRLPDMGIFRDVSLLGYGNNRISETKIRQEHKDHTVKLYIQVKTENQIQTTEGMRCRVTVTSPEGISWVYENLGECIVIEEPKLWWPNGYGQQNLYDIEILLIEGETILDRVQKKIGLRTLTVDTSKDEFGMRFTHVVNGVSIFGMGANYIPEDALLGKLSQKRTRTLLMECKEANFNVIRVWGGGHYPADYFYDICDELGLIVWQDFMFACGVYPMDEEFRENVKQEIIENVRRIRHHASLGLWCGNNENEMFIAENNWIKNGRQKADYLYLNEYFIPEILKKEDENTFYWPSSPSSGGGFDRPNDFSNGDTHYWDVWHKGVPFTEFRKFQFRYLSEFGFQAFPTMHTIESFTLPEDRNVFSYVMEKHQRNDAANGKILHYLSQTYRYPNNFEELIYASQLLSAEAIRYGVEHFRRNRGRCMGTIYWQLNDCWPGASWSSIDYLGNFKALHYYAKRFFAPVLLSCQEEGCLTQGMNVNEEGLRVEKSAVLAVTNETMEKKELTVKWSLCNSHGNVQKKGEYKLDVAPLSVWKSQKLSFEEADLHEDYLYYELWKENIRIIASSTLFCPPKHFAFQNPKLSLTVNGNEITVKAEQYAKGVEIYGQESGLKLSDNFFDMNAGEYTVQILEGFSTNLKIRSVYDIRG